LSCSTSGGGGDGGCEDFGVCDPGSYRDLAQCRCIPGSTPLPRKGRRRS
jgi:hypothetical protein